MATQTNEGCAIHFERDEQGRIKSPIRIPEYECEVHFKRDSSGRIETPLRIKNAQ